VGFVLREREITNRKRIETKKRIIPNFLLRLLYSLATCGQVYRQKVHQFGLIFRDLVYLLSIFFGLEVT